MTKLKTVADRLKFARERRKMTQETLRSAAGLRHQSIIGNLESGTRKSSTYLPAIANVLGVNALWLAEGKGAMEATDHNVEQGPDIHEQVPLISWIQAGEWCEIVDNFHPGDAEQWLPSPKKSSSKTYALRVRGISMEPKFQAGDIIFVDPEASYDHGKYVVVRLEAEKEATFKQLVIEGEKKYLRPLNPDWPEKIIPVNGSATICGVVIGKWVPIE